MKILFIAGTVFLSMIFSFVPMTYQDYEPFFLSRGLPLQIKEIPLGDNDYEVLLQKDGDQPVRYYLSLPEKSGKFPAVIVIGGLETGKKSVEIVSELAGERDLVLMGMDYPYYGKRSFKGWDVLPSIPAIRKAALDSVRGVVMMVDYLYQREDVAQDTIVLIGVSLGAPVSIVAGGIDERIAAVGALYGGGNIRRMVTSVTGSSIAGWTAGMLLAPVEPLDYVARISPRPLLMINSPEDEFIPYICTEQLYQKAGKPKKLIPLNTDHVLPDKPELLRELLSYVDVWLDEEGLILKSSPQASAEKS